MLASNGKLDTGASLANAVSSRLACAAWPPQAARLPAAAARLSQEAHLLQREGGVVVQRVAQHAHLQGKAATGEAAVQPGCGGSWLWGSCRGGLL